MSGVNKVILIGHLGSDPELRETRNDNAVCNFSLATNEAWTDRDGERQEKVEWHRIVTWGRLAEQCDEFLEKGRQVYVEGKLTTEEWEDDDGVKRYTTKINALTVQFLGGGSGEDRGSNDRGSGRTSSRSRDDRDDDRGRGRDKDRDRNRGRGRSRDSGSRSRGSRSDRGRDEAGAW